MFSTFSICLMSSFLTWFLSVWLHAHLHIFISITSNFFTRELVTGTVSIPYIIAGWTIIWCIFHLICGGTFLSHRTPDIFLQWFHPHFVLLFISVLISPSHSRVLPIYLFLQHTSLEFRIDGTCPSPVKLYSW